MLTAGGVGMHDDALSPYRLPRWEAAARLVALCCCEVALGDRVAWSLYVGLDGELAAYKAVYGNRRTRRKPRRLKLPEAERAAPHDVDTARAVPAEEKEGRLFP